MAKGQQTWFLEGLGFLVGASCLIATVGILRHYDGRVTPDLPVTLNFILPFLGNVAFAITLFGIQNALSQLKWVGFSRRSRPLSELDLFQHVRGGPVGAARLLLKAGSR